MRMKRVLAAAAVMAVFTAASIPTRAEQIVVTNYGVTAGGWPYMIAMEKGFFKDEGVDVTGILTSAGGGTTIRNILAANVPYGEVGPAIAVQANLAGANLRIVSDNLLSVADLGWVVKPDSPLKTPADIKGKKVGYTNPKSVTQGLSAAFVAWAGFKPNEVELVRTGGFGEGLAALDQGLIDVTPIGEPLLAQNINKYRVLARGRDVLPPLDNTVGVTTPEVAAQKGDFIRGVIRARRKGVIFLREHPDESAQIIAKVMNLPVDVVKVSIADIASVNTNGVPYIGEGQFHLTGIDRMFKLQQEIGAMDTIPDWRTYIDTSFLPDDLKKMAD